MRTGFAAKVALAAMTSLLPAACGTGDPPPPQPTQTSAHSAGPDESTFHATLAESAAARDLVDQLPVTIDMRDHGGVEKTGRLPAALSIDGQPDGADPGIGDVGYYAPGNDLVLYYGDQSYNDGIVILGRLGGQAAERIGELSGAITATVVQLDD